MPAQGAAILLLTFRPRVGAGPAANISDRGLTATDRVIALLTELEARERLNRDKYAPVLPMYRVVLATDATAYRAVQGRVLAAALRDAAALDDFLAGPGAMLLP
jgi:hypothetical protein